MRTPAIDSFFDPATFTVTHLVSDPVTRRAAIIDSVLDYNPKSGRVSHATADRLIEHVRRNGLGIDWLLETHAHADHLSAAAYLREQLGGRIGIGRHICDVQRVFKGLFNIKDLDTEGGDFDYLFGDNEVFVIGEIEVRILHTPGHTPACLTFVSGLDAFVGDTLFMPDYGTARADFPGGDAHQLYRSIRRVLSLPDETRLFLCHDYKAPGRDVYRWETTVGEERRSSVHVRDGVSEDEFVAMREARDATLAVPKLLLPSVQVNIRAGHFPEPAANGVQYLRIPVKLPGGRALA